MKVIQDEKTGKLYTFTFRCSCCGRIFTTADFFQNMCEECENDYDVFMSDADRASRTDDVEYIDEDF